MPFGSLTVETEILASQLNLSLDRPGAAITPEYPVKAYSSTNQINLLSLRISLAYPPSYVG